ncbi:UNVERIFIED_CONTAM: hypothetical protein FKN15_069720 [Acipenser sinensis]
MDTDLKALIKQINRNTAAQKEQNRRWRQERGLPDPEPTELELLLQKWEQAREALLSAAPEGKALLSQEEEEPLQSLEAPAAVKGEEVSQPPTLQASPALPREVPRRDIIDTQPECPDLPTLDLAPRSQHCQAQLLAWFLAPLPLETQTFPCRRKTSLRKRQMSLAFPLLVAAFLLVSQTSLRQSTAALLCLPVLAPGHRSALESPWTNRLSSSSPVLGPSLEAPEGPTHPEARWWKRAKIKEMTLEGGWSFKGGRR